MILRRTTAAVALALSALIALDAPAVAAPVTAPTAEDPVCMRIKGAEACVGADESDRPGIYVEDTDSDKHHPAVEYYLNGYLGTMYVIHNLAGESEIRGTRQLGRAVTFRVALYRGDHRVKAGRWHTLRDVTEHPVKRDTRVTPAEARQRSVDCAQTKSAALTCFTRKSWAVFACDLRADKYQARAEYFVGGDPTARYEIHQLAGVDTCGKAEHGDVAVSMYRASVFDRDRRVATKWYKYY